MRRFAAVGLLLAGGFLLFVALVLWGQRGHEVSIIPGVVTAVVGAALLHAAYRVDRARASQAAALREAEAAAAAAARRSSAETLAHWRHGQAVEVRPLAWRLPAGLLLVALGALFTWLGWLLPGRDAAFMLGLGVPALLGGAWSCARIWPGLGLPALRLGRDGVDMPLYGHLPWRDVAGLCVRVGTARDGRAVSFRLLFKLADVKRSVPHPHWTDRLLGRMAWGPLASGVATSGACPVDADPARVEALARRLWRDATGLDHPWHPGMTDAQLAVARRQGELLARLEQRAAGIGARAAAATPDELASLQRDLHELEDATAAAFPRPPAATRPRRPS